MGPSPQASSVRAAQPAQLKLQGNSLGSICDVKPRLEGHQGGDYGGGEGGVADGRLMNLGYLGQRVCPIRSCRNSCAADLIESSNQLLNLG